MPQQDPTMKKDGKHKSGHKREKSRDKSSELRSVGSSRPNPFQECSTRSMPSSVREPSERSEKRRDPHKDEKRDKREKKPEDCLKGFASIIDNQVIPQMKKGDGVSDIQKLVEMLRDDTEDLKRREVEMRKWIEDRVVDCERMGAEMVEIT